jgi:hypothetical protein
MAIKFVHKVNSGDLISSLPGIKKVCDDRGEKAIIYQMLNRPGEYFIGAKHPVVDESGAMVCFNAEMHRMMKPLLEAQDYIESFEIYEGQQVDYDLDVIRQDVYCGAPHFPLQKWTWMAYPEMTCDLSKSWIDVHSRDCIVSIRQNGQPSWYQGARGSNHNAVILNFTERYRNYNVNYHFLRNHEKDLVFAGVKQEHELFCSQWKLDIPLLLVDDFEHLASAIKGARFFMGNQSMCWHIAQAMHVPRILELYPHVQNCTNFGVNGYEFYNTKAAQYHFEKLFNQ